MMPGGVLRQQASVGCALVAAELRLRPAHQNHVESGWGDLRVGEQAMDLAAVMGLMIEEMGQDLRHRRVAFFARHIGVVELAGEIGIAVAADHGADAGLFLDPRGP